MDVQVESVAEFKAGQITATTTPQSLPAYRACKEVKLKNIGANPILIGDYKLEAGHEVSIPVDRGDKVVVHTASSTSRLAYIIQ